MNFKNISLIIPLLSVGLKAIAGPVINEAVSNEYDEEVFSSEEDIDLKGDDVKYVEIYFDNENISTEVISAIGEEEHSTEVISAIGEEEEEECSSEKCIQTSKRILENMDISVDPCEDFYHFSCGGWESRVRSHEIDNLDTFSKLRILVKKEIQEIIKGEYTVDEKLSKEDQIYDEKIFKKLKNAYNICMKREINESYPNELLINFVKSFNITEMKDKLKDKEELTNLFVKLQTNGIESFVKINVVDEETVSDRPVVGLTIPPNIFGRSTYYAFSSKLPESVPIIKDYIKNIYTSIAGKKNNIDSIVDSIYETESKISKINQESKALSIAIVIANGKNPDKTESFKLNELNEKYPIINWNSYIKNIFEFYNLSEFVNDDMLIYNPFPDYYEKINQLVSELSIDDLINYLEWNIIASDVFDDYVSEDVVKANEEFDDKMDELIFSKLSIEEINELYGTDISDIIDIDEIPNTSSLFNKKYFKGLQKRDDDKSEEDKYSMCYNYLESIMSKAISRYFVKNTFDDNIKGEVKEMIENVKEAMIDRIPKTEWLDDETREFAIQKVLKMKDRIAYPDEIMDPKKLYQDYKDLEINNYFEFLINTKVLGFGSNLKHINGNEWITTPQTVNAFYHPTTNSINFPAAILQSPFYSSDEQDYINYGTSGSVIGHELTHAFDNTGRLYDADGKYRNWWTDNDNEEFTEYAQCFIDEYNSFTYQVKNKKLNVNGEKTLGENLADNGGVARAYDAWQLSLSKNPERAAQRNKKLPGFENYTIDQLFYIAYGQSFCSIEQKELKLDPHSPGIARINGVVVNSEHFAKTFNCPKKSAMNPEKKCVIW